MMRFKIVAGANLVFGIIQIIYSLIILFIVIPRMMLLYNEFGTGLPCSSYIVPLAILISGIIAFILALLLIKQKAKLKERLFTISLIYLAAVVIFAGFFSGASVLSIIIPLYSISSEI